VRRTHELSINALDDLHVGHAAVEVALEVKHETADGCPTAGVLAAYDKEPVGPHAEAPDFVLEHAAKRVVSPRREQEDGMLVLREPVGAERHIEANAAGRQAD
jgi:hypothetical protein